MLNQDTDSSSNGTAFEAMGYRTPHFEPLGVKTFMRYILLQKSFLVPYKGPMLGHPVTQIGSLDWYIVK